MTNPPTHSNPGPQLSDNARDSLPLVQISLALDRTTLAWIRTALTFATFGFGMVTFFRGLVQAAPSEHTMRLHHAAISMGVSFIVMGIVATLLAAVTHWMTLRRMRRGDPLPLAQWPLTIVIAILLALVGLYALWSVLAS
jgi:putative membrane protein